MMWQDLRILIVDVVEVDTLKQHFCAMRVAMCALIHLSICFGIQFTPQRKHITIFLWLSNPLLIALSTTRIISSNIYYMFEVMVSQTYKFFLEIVRWNCVCDTYSYYVCHIINNMWSILWIICDCIKVYSLNFYL